MEENNHNNHGHQQQQQQQQHPQQQQHNPNHMDEGGGTIIGHGIGMGRHQPTGMGIAQLPPMQAHALVGMGQMNMAHPQQQQQQQQGGGMGMGGMGGMGHMQPHPHPHHAQHQPFNPPQPHHHNPHQLPPHQQPPQHPQQQQQGEQHPNQMSPMVPMAPPPPPQDQHPHHPQQQQQQQHRGMGPMNLPPTTINATARGEAGLLNTMNKNNNNTNEMEAEPAPEDEGVEAPTPTADTGTAPAEETPSPAKLLPPPPSGRSRTWDDNFAALVAYKQRYGNCLVPVSFPEDPALGRWCAKLRKIKETLKPERRARLEYLGFQFTNPKFAMEEKNWQDNFVKLRDHYMSQDGAGGGQKLDPQLNRWVSRQRRNKKDGIMLDERANQLESIGFKWVIMEQKPKDYTKKDLHWINQYNALVVFQKQTGHTNVPHGKGNYASLAKWVARQRELFFQKRLLEERKQLLNTLGFVWSMEEKAWNDNFEKLKAFVIREGSLDFQASPDPSIQRWFYAQRVKYANHNLSVERLRQLESLGLRFDGTKAYLGGDDPQRDSQGNHEGDRNNNGHGSHDTVPATCHLQFPLRPPEGTKIRKKRFMEGWCNGEVVKREEKRAKVRYDDGDEEYLSEEEYRLSAIAYQLHKEPPKATMPKILVPIKRGRGRPKGSRNKRALPGNLKRGPGRPPKEQQDAEEDNDEPASAKKAKRPDPPNLPKTPYQNIIGSAPGENQDEVLIV